MAALTSNAKMSDRWRHVAILCSRQRWFHAAAVTSQAVGCGRQVERNFTRALIRRCHVPQTLLCVPVHWRFKEKSICRKQVAAPGAIRSDVVEQFARAVDC